MADDDQANDGDYYYNEGNLSYACTAWAPILGFMGIASAVTFASKYCSIIILSVLKLFIDSLTLIDGFSFVDLRALN
jgi:hypothetical protein